MKTESLKQVVVRGTNWVGDAVMTVPALRELRRVLPAARITLCTRGWATGVFEDADFIDDLLIYEKQKNPLSAVWRQAASWRERRVDLAVLFQNAFEAALLAKLGGAKNRFGYQTDGRALLLTEAVEVPAWKNDRHEVFYYLNLIADLETKLRGETQVWQREPDISLAVSESRREAARKFLAENEVDLTKKIIALCPGSTNSRAKRWQTESFAALTDLIQENLSAQVVLIGSPEELEVSAKILAQSTTKPILLTGKTSLAEAVAVLSVVDLLVTNDTGPAHIAPAVGTQTIVIFGPTEPKTTRPFSGLAMVVAKPPACAPCLLRDCPIDHRCMTAIEPPEIYQMVRRLMISK